MIDLLLRRAAVNGIQELVDIAVDAGSIVGRGPGLEFPARQEFDLGGRLVVPGFVDGHVHLDIALTNSWDRPGRSEPYRSQMAMVQEAERRRKGFTSEDIVARASAALEMGMRHGLTALRAQCHVDTEIGLKHLEALQAVKEKYAGKVTLQIVAFPEHGLLGDPDTIPLFRHAFRSGADVMGCSPGRDHDRYGNPVNPGKHIETAFELAAELDVDVDMHADIALPPQGQEVRMGDLQIVDAARRAIEMGYQGRLNAGHLCALGAAAPEVAEQVIALVAEAGVNVISLPDLYRLGRQDTHNVRRGLTRVKQLIGAGVNVAYASNNVRDALRPFGNLDMVEEGLILAYGAHMDTTDELETIMQMATYNAARCLKLSSYGLEAGSEASMVVLDAPSPSAAIVGQAEKLYVFKAGRLVARNRCESDLMA